MRTLVLNAGFEPMQLISWQRAMCLIFSEKAEVLSSYGKKIHTVSTAYALPSVIRLKRYVNVIHKMRIIRCSRKNILSRDLYKCQYCSAKLSGMQATLDHIIPKSKGGKSSWQNLVTACKPCNLKKGSKTPEQVGLKLRKTPKKPGLQELAKMDVLNHCDAWQAYQNLMQPQP